MQHSPVPEFTGLCWLVLYGKETGLRVRRVPAVGSLVVPTAGKAQPRGFPVAPPASAGEGFSGSQGPRMSVSAVVVKALRFSGGKGCWRPPQSFLPRRVLWLTRSLLSPRCGLQVPCSHLSAWCLMCWEPGNGQRAGVERWCTGKRSSGSQGLARPLWPWPGYLGRLHVRAELACARWPVGACGTS